MAEIARKSGVQKCISPASTQGTTGRGLRCCITEVTTGGAETSGTVTMTTDFGTVGLTGTSGLLTFLPTPVGVTVQQDDGTVVANASVTAAGVVTTGTIVAAKNYWVIAFAI